MKLDNHSSATSRDTPIMPTKPLDSFSRDSLYVVEWIDEVAIANLHDPRDCVAQKMLQYCHDIVGGGGDLDFDTSELQSGFDFYLGVAHQGMTTGQFYVGICYLQGISEDIAPNHAQAFEFLTRASNRYHVGGHYGLAECYARGWGTPGGKDYEKALELYHRAASQGHAGAFYALATFYLHGYGMAEKNVETAIGYLKKAANKNLGKAHHLLGKYYLTGEASEWIKQDVDIAKVCFETSLQHGFKPALYTLALLHYHGYGSTISQDFPLAVKYLHEAASPEVNIAEAQWKLGCCHAHGIGGIEKNLSNALEWYLQASKPRQNEDGELEQNSQAVLGLALFCVLNGHW